MKVKRILHVTDSMNKGGIETFIMNVYRNINRENIQFDFLISVSEKCDYEDEILELGGRIYRTIPKTKGIFNYIQKTNNVLKEMPNYEVVHIHVSSLISALGWLLTNVKNIPNKMYHSHNTESSRDFTGILRKGGQIILKQNSTHLLACSVAAGEWLYGNKNFKKDKAVVINNGIDTEKFCYDKKVRKDMRESLNLDNKFVIGHIGRFNKQKNHDFIIEIFKEIYNQDKNAILMLVGKGDLESTIYNKVKEYKLQEAVLFLGLREDISPLLNSMDIFLLPSFHEGLPVVGIEAQATGIKSFMSDKVTTEVDVTGLVDFISLDQPAEIWAGKILNYKNYNRVNTKQFIIENGFDIKEVTSKLSSLYTNGEG